MSCILFYKNLFSFQNGGIPNLFILLDTGEKLKIKNIQECLGNEVDEYSDFLFVKKSIDKKLKAK